MRGTDHAFQRSISLAHDGDVPVDFCRLPLAPPLVERAFGRDFVIVRASGLAALAERVFSDIQFRLRPSAIEALANTAFDPDADERDRYVARTLLDNASIAAAGTFPMCQDTGTAAVYGWKGAGVIVDYDVVDYDVVDYDVVDGADNRGGDVGSVRGHAARHDAVSNSAVASGDDDIDALASGAFAAWRAKRLRNSQVVPLSGFGERNTGDNTPLSAHIIAAPGDAYRFLFVAKGGGSSNKTALYQETKRLLGPESFAAFVEAAIGAMGVSACPPYRIAVILGGQSPEEATIAGRLASAGALDALPSDPGESGGPYRDRLLEAVVMDVATRSGWGAQFGGRFMARDARVIRLPRHAASLPVVVAVSCSAHRQAYAYVSRDGWFVERLADGDDIERIVQAAERRDGRTNTSRTGAAALDAEKPARGVDTAPHLGVPPDFGKARRVDLGGGEGRIAGTPNAGTAAVVAGLRSGELVELWGAVVLARDAAHARLLAMVERGERLPEWIRYPAFYASPTETPDGAAIGSIGPTTARRMDSYLDAFGAAGIFPLSIGKGERGPACREACGRYGLAYLAAVGGAAALAATRYVAASRVIDWPELGMEAIRLVELQGLPALVVVDSRGNDYYEALRARR